MITSVGKCQQGEKVPYRKKNVKMKIMKNQIKKVAWFALCSFCCMEMTAQTKVIAHRGFWKAEGAAQNSIIALRRAADACIYGSEFDVLMTADGVVVVNHDDIINGKVIEETSYAEIKDCKLPNGETLPTLRSYLEEGSKYNNLQLILEIKPHKKIENENRAVETIVKMVRALKLETQVEYISFSMNICQQLEACTPESPIYYLNGDLAPREIKQKGFSGIDYEYEVLKNNPQWIEQAHQLGLKVNCWTVNKRSDMAEMIRSGVDFLTTDYPLAAKDYLSRKKDAGK